MTATPECMPEAVANVLAAFAGVGLGVLLVALVIGWSLFGRPAWADWRAARRKAKP